MQHAPRAADVSDVIMLLRLAVEPTFGSLMILVRSSSSTFGSDSRTF